MVQFDPDAPELKLPHWPETPQPDAELNTYLIPVSPETGDRKQ